MPEPDPRTRAVAMIVAFLHDTGWLLCFFVFFQPRKGHGGSYDNGSAGGWFWKPPWVHGAAGPSGMLCVWAETWVPRARLCGDSLLNPNCLPGGCIHNLPFRLW